jgi:hypothetical protein
VAAGAAGSGEDRPSAEQPEQARVSNRTPLNTATSNVSSGYGSRRVSGEEAGEALGHAGGVLYVQQVVRTGQDVWLGRRQPFEQQCVA